MNKEFNAGIITCSVYPMSEPHRRSMIGLQPDFNPYSHSLDRPSLGLAQSDDFEPLAFPSLPRRDCSDS